MTERETSEETERLAGRIAREYDPEQVILYGSWAWGEPSPDSDVDLFVIKDSQKTTLEMMREVDSLTADRQVPLDVLVYTPEQCRSRLRVNDPFIKRVMTAGKVLYDKAKPDSTGVA